MYPYPSEILNGGGSKKKEVFTYYMNYDRDTNFIKKNLNIKWYLGLGGVLDFSFLHSYSSCSGQEKPDS
jgi:hypothetical protein